MLDDHATYAPVRSRTAFGETYRRLESAIKLGLLAPGSRLPAERELCTRLGISRSTLRQALTALTESGHLHATRGRGGGTFVVDRPPAPPPATLEQQASWRELSDHRLAIELGVAALAARRRTEAGLTAVRQMARRMATVTEFPDYCRADRQLHIAIAGLTDNPTLVVESARIQSAISDLLCAIESTDGRIGTANTQHDELIAAFAAGDEDGAKRAMAEHLASTEKLFAQALAG